MDKSENILWTTAGVCTAVWLFGWVGMDAGIWIHTFIVAALVIGTLILADGLKTDRAQR